MNTFKSIVIIFSVTASMAVGGCKTSEESPVEDTSALVAETTEEPADPAVEVAVNEPDVEETVVTDDAVTNAAVLPVVGDVPVPAVAVDECNCECACPDASSVLDETNKQCVDFRTVAPAVLLK